MSILQRIATIDSSVQHYSEDNINQNKTLLSNVEIESLLKTLKREIQTIILSNKSFIQCLGALNRIIINANNKYILQYPIKKFNAAELARISYKGFKILYQDIQYQYMDNIVKNSRALTDININDDFDKLSADKRAEICKFICDNLNTSELYRNVFYEIGKAFEMNINDVIGRMHNNMPLYEISDFFTVNDKKSLHPSFLTTWLRFGFPNLVKKINNIIHNTVPIIVDNYDQYDDNKELNEKGTDPNTWIEKSDEDDPINGIQISNTAPMYFSSIRISPLVVLDNEVLLSTSADAHHNNLIDNYKKKIHKEDADNASLAYTEGTQSILEELNAQNMAIGSLFNGTVALLEYVTDGREEDLRDDNDLIRPNNGNKDAIIQALRNQGVKKIYMQNVSPWVSREYERVARRHLMKKIFG